jgi:enoyl-CoA hydratase
MNFADYKSLALQRAGRVLYAAFNKPETLNAITDDVHDDLDHLFSDVADDPETNVLVLTGTGRAFSAGGNIDEMIYCLDHPEQFHKNAVRGEHHLYNIMNCPKPVIAKVNGAAIGLGATLALYCDIVVAASRAKIADPHVQLALSAGDGGAIIWPALMGFAKAKAYLFTGDPVTGEEAERLGLIYRAVPAEELDEFTDNLAQRIANGAPKAIQYTKLSANIALKALCEATLHQSFEMELRSSRTKDHREAVHAFREKRAPQFTGE